MRAICIMLQCWIKVFEWAVAYPFVFPKSCLQSIINFEGTTSQNLIFYLHHMMQSPTELSHSKNTPTESNEQHHRGLVSLTQQAAMHGSLGALVAH